MPVLKNKCLCSYSYQHRVLIAMPSQAETKIQQTKQSLSFTLGDLVAELLGLTLVNYTCLAKIGYLCRNRLLSLKLPDYVATYVNLLSYDYGIGLNTTRIATNESEFGYTNIKEVQWNDNDKTLLGQEDSVNTRFTNPRSLLNKTKRIFMQGEMDTVVARFHTEGNNDPEHNQVNASTKAYGMSHGRNLLSREGERGDPLMFNGYDNPYCRVWTYHHQYNSIDKLIRPFIENSTPTPIGDLQAPWTFIRGKDGAKILGDNTVINKNGFVNITPSFNVNKDLKVHTKQCMFSIENLAWKGYKKHDFENTLSWEQRGPLGGRIMWFPPYDISFNENTSVNWNEDTFIGRGENVYTYVNTQRTGNLHFKLVVDHPSIINYYEGNNQYGVIPQNETLPANWEGVNGAANNLQDTLNRGFRGSNVLDGSYYEQVVSIGKGEKKDNDLLRFFAGCETIQGKAKNLTDETAGEREVVENEPPVSPTPPAEPEEKKTEPKPGKFIFYVYYPNNYSGKDDKPGNTVEAMAYLLNGIVCQKESDGETDGMLQFNDLRNHLTDDGVGTGFEMSKSLGISHLYEENGPYGYMNGRYEHWQYRVDMDTINQRLIWAKNEIDLDTDESGSQNGLNIDVSIGISSKVEEDSGATVYSFAEVAYALSGIELIKQKAGSMQGFDEHVNNIKEILSTYEISNVEFYGIANSHGNNAVESVNQRRNDSLSYNRALSVKLWLKTQQGFKELADDDMTVDEYYVQDITTKSTSNLEAKQYRCARVVVNYSMSDTKSLSETTQETSEGEANSTQFQEDKIEYLGEKGGIEYGACTDKTNNKRLYYKRPKGSTTWEYFEYPASNTSTGTTGTSVSVISREQEFNNIRYDQEYHFFEILKEKDPFTWEKFTDKIKYFNPAFHSITPEGFSARLNFLQQCCRQGNTIGSSDGTQNATNLAFGRAPYCVLRLGDFYYTKIVINNMSWSFDPLVWDLNSEGIGVQPLIADIDISFTFIGGSDIKGPIARLQNAMTFNYLANTSVYDNRADRVEYGEDGKEKNYQAHVVPTNGN